MSVSRITPRMVSALRSGSRLRFFADVWTDVLQGGVDSAAEWADYTSKTNIDLTTDPAAPRLTSSAGMFTISQTSDNAGTRIRNNPYVSPGPPYGFASSQTVDINAAFQKFYLQSPRSIDAITVKLDNSGGNDCTVFVQIVSGLSTVTSYNYPQYTIIASASVSVAAGFNSTKTLTFSTSALPAGYYWILAWAWNSGNNSTCYLRYQNTDVYSGGQLDVVSRPASAGLFTWTSNIGDAYFVISMSGYTASGSIVTPTVDVGGTPPAAGRVQIGASVPNGTNLISTLYGSSTGAFAGEETAYPSSEDGSAIGAFRYWRARFDLASSGDFSATPVIDSIEFSFPNKRVLMREKEALTYADSTITGSYRPILARPEYKTSELKVIERVASGGSMTLEIEDSVPDTIRSMVSDSPLKNYRCEVYIGCDVPGFTETDLLRFFVGLVDSADLRPRYRGTTYGLSIQARNPILEMKRKAPVSTAGGALDLATLSISHDGICVLDSMLDIFAQAAIPARYVDIESFDLMRSQSAHGSLVLGGIKVYRSNAAGLADTRIKSPEELATLLAPLAVIADGYIVEDESSRIKFVRHDASAAAVADYADEALVKNGLDAEPIETISTIKLGYDDFLWNACYCGHTWSGSGDKWTDFGEVFAYVDSTSAAEFAPGAATYLSVMEKNMIAVSKWLGPETGYLGATIAQTIAASLVQRFAYAPARIIGAVLPVSQFVRTLGDVVTITSEEFCKYGRRGIAESETKKFMIIKKTYNSEKNRMIFDLLELT